MLVSISTIKGKGTLKKNLMVSIAIFIKEINEIGFKIWTQVRLEEGPLYGKLEFPGGKIELGETPIEACRREVLEEVGISIPRDKALSLFKYQDYSFGEKNICLHVFISNFSDLPDDGGQWHEITYLGKSDFLKGRIPEINHVIIDELAVYINEQNDSGCIQNIWPQQIQ